MINTSNTRHDVVWLTHDICHQNYNKIWVSSRFSVIMTRAASGYKDDLPMYVDSQYKDSAVIRASYQCNGNAYNGKTVSLYWGMTSSSLILNMIYVHDSIPHIKVWTFLPSEQMPGIYKSSAYLRGNFKINLSFMIKLWYICTCHFIWSNITGNDKRHCGVNAAYCGALHRSAHIYTRHCYLSNCYWHAICYPFEWYTMLRLS